MHHEGAVFMVEQLFASPGAGQESVIFGFASDVVADQSMELLGCAACAACSKSAEVGGVTFH